MKKIKAAINTKKFFINVQDFRVAQAVVLKNSFCLIYPGKSGFSPKISVLVWVKTFLGVKIAEKSIPDVIFRPRLRKSSQKLKK